MAKCSECGYLAVRNLKGEPIEASDQVRQRGKMGEAHADFFCWMGNAAFAPFPEISVERTCDDFCRRRRGQHPREHEQAMFLKELLAQWREMERERDERQKQRDDDDRSWREKQEELADRRHKEALKLAHDSHWRELLVLGFMMMLTTLIAACISRGGSSSTTVPVAPGASAETSVDQQTKPPPAAKQARREEGNR